MTAPFQHLTCTITPPSFLLFACGRIRFWPCSLFSRAACVLQYTTVRLWPESERAAACRIGVRQVGSSAILAVNVELVRHHAPIYFAPCPPSPQPAETPSDRKDCVTVWRCLLLAERLTLRATLHIVLISSCPVVAIAIASPVSAKAHAFLTGIGFCGATLCIIRAAGTCIERR